MKIHKSSNSSVGSGSPDPHRSPSPTHILPDNRIIRPSSPQNFVIKRVENIMIKREDNLHSRIGAGLDPLGDHHPHHVSPAYILSRRESIDAVIQAELAADKDTEEIGPEYYYARQNLQNAFHPDNRPGPNPHHPHLAQQRLLPPPPTTVSSIMKSRHPSNGVLDQKLAALNAAAAIVSLPQSLPSIIPRQLSSSQTVVKQNLHQAVVSMGQQRISSQLNAAIRQPSLLAAAIQSPAAAHFQQQLNNQPTPLNFSNLSAANMSQISAGQNTPVSLRNCSNSGPVDNPGVLAQGPPNVKMELMSSHCGGVMPTSAPVAQTLSQIMQNKVKVVILFYLNNLLSII